jgi:hypothetical protein
MSDAEAEKRTDRRVNSWFEDNQWYLSSQLRRLRLLLQRRVMWLRRQWRHDPLQPYHAMVISEAQADWLLAGEDHQAEARFYQDDPEAAEVSRMITKIEQEMAGQTRVMMDAGTPPALEMLVQLFRLTVFERNLVLLCLAPELDPTFERLYAYVQDDLNRKYVTPHLALTLFTGEGWDRLSLQNSFLPEAPLRRFRLVTLESGPSTLTLAARPLLMDGRVVDYLRGVNRLDERLTDLLRPIAPPLLAPPNSERVDSIVRSFQSGLGQGQWPVLNLTGPPEAGKRPVARAVCDGLGLHVYALDLKRLPTPVPEWHETMHLLEREAVLSQFALYVDAAEPESADKTMTDSIGNLIERVGVFFIIGSRERWPTEREILAVHVPKPDAGAQRILWQQALTGIRHSLDGHVDAIVQQFDFGPEAISQVVAAAKGRALLFAAEDEVSLNPDDFWQACREQAGWHLGELAQRITPFYSWEDIILPKDVFQQLQEIAAQVANRAQVYEEWGFGAKLSRGRGISALFSGPSGTGKTMAAEILANHLKLDLYRIDLAGVVSKYIGETEKNLRRVFDAAEQSGAILFFDEADALFGKRTEVRDSHDRYANIEVNYLLQRMEDYRGLAILATNMKNVLDNAFLRRLRFLVEFPFPDADSRRRIWQRVFSPQAPVDGLDYNCLARLEIAGGNIRNIALNAAFLASNEEASIEMGHVMRATRREYTKIDKLITQAEFGPYYGLMKS